MSRLCSVSLASTLLLAALSVSAQAGGLGGSIKDAPPAEEVYRWNGLSLAAGIGAGRLAYDVDAHGCKEHSYDYYRIDTLDEVMPATGFHCYGYEKHAAFSSDEWKAFGTLQIGYDRLISDRILVGAFADIDFYFDADNAFAKSWYNGAKAIHGNVDLDNVWSIGAKLGILVSPRVLLYGVGGYTEARVDGSVTAKFGYDTATASIDDTLRGWFVGGGAELKLREHVSLRLEYRYADYNGSSFLKTETYDGYYCDKDITVHGDLDAQIHTVRAALVLKLGDLHERAHEPLK